MSNPTDHCPIVWCTRTGPHAAHYRVMFEVDVWHGGKVELSVGQVGDDAPDLTLWVHDRDGEQVESADYSIEQSRVLTKALTGLEYARVIALTGTIGAAVALLTKDDDR